MGNGSEDIPLPPIEYRQSAAKQPDGALPPVDYRQPGYTPPEPGRPVEDYEDMPWSEVATNAVQSAPDSAGRAISGVWDAVTHPVETGEALWNIPKGLGSKAARYLHEEYGIGNNRRTPEQIAADERVVDAIGGDYSGRYGSMAGFKKGLSEDPFAYGMDVASVVPVVGAGARVAGTTGTVGKALGVASKASEFLDPVQLAMKAAGTAGRVGKIANSVASGVSKGAFDIAQDVGRYGSPEERAALTAGQRKADLDLLPKQAMAAIGDIKAKNSLEYRNAKGSLAKTSIDRQPILDAIAEVGVDLRGPRNGRLLHPELYSILEDMAERAKLIDDTTPEGLDALKRSFNDTIGKDVPPNWRGAFKKVTDAIKSTVDAVDPQYGKMLGQYGDAADELNDIVKSLSGGEKAAATTRMMKLLNSIGNEGRLRLVDKLDATPSGRGLKAYIAGHNLSKWTPGYARGFADIVISALTSMAFGASPTLALGSIAAPFALGSPRAYGNLAYATGMTQRGVDAVRPGLGAADNVLSQIGQQEEEDRAPRKSGGRVGAKASVGADRLIRAAEKARKQLGTSTEPLLNTPDHTVASALEIANRSI